MKESLWVCKIVMDCKDVGVVVLIGVGFGFVVGWFIRGCFLRRIFYLGSVKNIDVNLIDVKFNNFVKNNYYIII